MAPGDAAPVPTLAIVLSVGTLQRLITNSLLLLLLEAFFKAKRRARDAGPSYSASRCGKLGAVLEVLGVLHEPVTSEYVMDELVVEWPSSVVVLEVVRRLPIEHVVHTEANNTVERRRITCL